MRTVLFSQSHIEEKQCNCGSKQEDTLHRVTLYWFICKHLNIYIYNKNKTLLLAVVLLQWHGQNNFLLDVARNKGLLKTRCGLPSTSPPSPPSSCSALSHSLVFATLLLHTVYSLHLVSCALTSADTYVCIWSITFPISVTVPWMCSLDAESLSELATTLCNQQCMWHWTSQALGFSSWPCARRWLFMRNTRQYLDL